MSPEGTQTLKDVPKSEVATVVAGFKAQGASPVETKEQPDGRFTVIATFPSSGGGGA
ncbi:MAG TPA: hypothetical protein VFV05_24965 [Methylomirabilota bacterium]|nr:hypothetical protein [Methylomirabilota bacterium]